MNQARKILVALVLVGILGAGDAYGNGQRSSAAIRTLGPNAAFTASDTASILVRFPRRVSLDQLRVEIRGKGRVSGFILRKVGSFDDEARRPVVENLRIGQCEEQGCAGYRSFSMTTGFNTGDGLSGVWRLFVVADGAPVTLVFEPDEGAPVHPVDVTDPVDAEIKTLSPRAQVHQDNRVLSAGDFTSLEEVDLVHLGLWVIGDPGHVTAWGDCRYMEGWSTGPASFLPGCPAGDGHAQVAPPSPDRPGVIFSSTAFGDYRGIGGWFGTTAAVKRYGAVGFWMHF